MILLLEAAKTAGGDGLTLKDFIPYFVTIVVALLASSGFWAWLGTKDKQKSAMTQLLLGIAHDRIIFLGMSYVDRGWITKDEYEDFVKYLYEPYKQFGGNGLAEKVMTEVQKLPMRGAHPIATVIKERNDQ